MKTNGYTQFLNVIQGKMASQFLFNYLSKKQYKKKKNQK